MSSMLRKGMSWLGLGPDEEYEDYDFVDDGFDDEPLPQQGGPAHTTPRAAASRPQVITEDWDEPEPGGIRVLPPSSSPSTEGSRVRGVVRPLPTASAARPQVVSPKTFNDAQEVGDLVKRRQPVILNLQGLDRDLKRRLLDFASGVAYGLGGTVERAATHVYLITPVDVEVSAEDRRRIREGVLAD